MIRAIYPGTFDPITNGHIDIINRTANLFDEVIVAISANIKKEPFLNLEARLELANTIFKKNHNIKVKTFNGLLIDFAMNNKIKFIIRGLRAVSDFEYEFQLAGMNRNLDPNIETIFMPSNEKYANISSSLVKEVFLLGGDISSFVPKEVINKLKLQTVN